ncbi:sulfatase [Gelidibacter mesophilus]|uniref:sulfatase n=1 Tax=Gelidibacter mesophilus TaxID=169050 RepID=UPI0003FFB9EB|nr:sulfatase [Gelidibacter mesophilus]
MRLNIQFSISVTLFLFCVTFSNSQEKTENSPNIIIFLIDDIGLMDTSVPFLTNANGDLINYPLNDYYITPNMEKLAEQGIRFTNFYAHSVCSPSRTSIMTGQNSARHRVTNWIKSEDNNRTEFGPAQWNWNGLSKVSITLPRLLQQKGYKTIHVGKAHFGPFNSEGEDPLNLGFDVNIAGSSIGQPGSYLGTESFGHDGGNLTRAVPGLEKYHGQDIFLTEALTLEANLAISEAKEEGKPFFLNMSHYAVHAPFYSDARFKDHYINSGKSENAQAYATLIEGMDKSLGDLMQHVKNLGLGENTLILFLGDNGSDAPLPNENDYSSSSPLKGKKGNHWEGGMRVPFIAAWVTPNKKANLQKKLPIAQNAVQNQLGSILDIFPTLSHLTNITPPERYNLDGFDLHDQLSGKKNHERRVLFLNHFPHGNHRSNYFTSLVDADWKIIYHYQPKSQPRYELYDLKEDPFETNNLADKNPEQLKIMMAALSDEMNTKNALYPENGQEKFKLVIPR